MDWAVLEGSVVNVNGAEGDAVGGDGVGGHHAVDRDTNEFFKNVCHGTQPHPRQQSGVCSTFEQYDETVLAGSGRNTSTYAHGLAVLGQSQLSSVSLNKVTSPQIQKRCNSESEEHSTHNILSAGIARQHAQPLAASVLWRGAYAAHCWSS